MFIHGTSGFGLGAFFSLMSSSFAYEDPYLRSQSTLNTTQKARQIFKEMGKGMLSSGKSFGKIGAMFAGVECVIESVCSMFTVLSGGLSQFIVSIGQKMIFTTPYQLGLYQVEYLHDPQAQREYSLVVLHLLRFRQQ